MTKTLYILLLSFIGAMFYCVLLESFMYLDILTGLLIGFMGSLMFFRYSKINAGFATILSYIVFVLKVIAEIYRSAFFVIINLFKDDDTKVEKIKLKQNISYITIANGYTLTPGSVALGQEDDHLLVLMFDRKKKDKKQ